MTDFDEEDTANSLPITSDNGTMISIFAQLYASAPRYIAVARLDDQEAQ
jgi:hypothetical protein